MARASSADSAVSGSGVSAAGSAGSPAATAAATEATSAGTGWAGNSRRQRQFILRFVIGLLIGVVIWIGFALYNHFTAVTTINPLNMQISKLTENGAAVSGAI